MSKTIYPNLEVEMILGDVEKSQLAEATGSSKSTVNNWLSGRTSISHTACVAIRDTFFQGKSTDYLFDRRPLNASVSDGQSV